VCVIVETILEWGIVSLGEDWEVVEKGLCVDIRTYEE
jgi:hypothetical protein